MTTDLPTNIRAPQTNDAFSMAAAGVSCIDAVGTINGREVLLRTVENHPAFRAPRPCDAYQMAAEKVACIKGVIETRMGTRLVPSEQRHYAVA